MNADVDVIRLPAKDSTLNHFIKAGEFKNKGEFITYATKKAINEVILKELEEKSRTTPQMAEKDGCTRTPIVFSPSHVRPDWKSRGIRVHALVIDKFY